MRVTMAGEGRITSGNKINAHLDGYHRSTHNKSSYLLTTAAPGTVIPFLTDVLLPGQRDEFRLAIDAMTLPTNGPLFNGYKIEAHLFRTPMRLYNAVMHMNKSRVGHDLQQIKFPLVEINGWNFDPSKDPTGQQINPSCLLAYQGIAGLGYSADDSELIKRQFCAHDILAYYSICKEYIWNKQENIGAIIHNSMTPFEGTIDKIFLRNGTNEAGGTSLRIHPNGTGPGDSQFEFNPNTTLEVTFTVYEEFDLDRLKIKRRYVGNHTTPSVLELFHDYVWDELNQKLTLSNPKYPTSNDYYNSFEIDNTITNANALEPRITTFPLTNIDDMHLAILQHTPSTPFIIDNQAAAPYGLPLFDVWTDETEFGTPIWSAQANQEGLALKTYDSDLFNNWMAKEFVDGDNGINELTKIVITDNEFTINDFIVNKQIFDLLTRVNMTDGSLYAYKKVAYDIDEDYLEEMPIFEGGLIKNIDFASVISNAAAAAGGTEQPLGTLGGRGTIGGRHEGGHVKINTGDWAILTGILMITPEIVYSQGNKWHTNLKSLADLHVPALDAISFQPLITDQMAYFDTKLDDITGPIFKSAGYQPSWINYQTDIPRALGNFAFPNDSGFMVQNRNYEVGSDGDNKPTIKDLTTIIDPKKHNYAFANGRRDAQNFWVKVSWKRETRLVMSGNQIPKV